MGMFDTVEYTMDCPVCGQSLDGFQSKDSWCALDTISPAELYQQRHRGLKTVTFYSNCANCATFVDVTLRQGHTEYPRENLRGPLPEELWTTNTNTASATNSTACQDDPPSASTASEPSRQPE